MHAYDHSTGGGTRSSQCCQHSEFCVQQGDPVSKTQVENNKRQPMSALSLYMYTCSPVHQHTHVHTCMHPQPKIIARVLLFRP